MHCHADTAQTQHSYYFVCSLKRYIHTKVYVAAIATCLSSPPSLDGELYKQAALII